MRDICFCILICFSSCLRSQHSQKEKDTFLRIINWTKDNRIDSLKMCFSDQYEKDSTRFLTEIESAKWILENSNSNIHLDSIQCHDSTFVKHEKSFMYFYTLNFSDNAKRVGKIEVEFYNRNHEGIVPINIFSTAYKSIDIDKYNKLFNEIK